MRSNSYWLTIVLAATLACGEVLEENISNRIPVLKAPSDSSVVYSDTVTFWWDRVDGASSYQISLVSPDFENTQRVILDSIVLTNHINVAIKYGYYAWEVKALNSGYSSLATRSVFRVDSINAVNIEDLLIQIISPVDQSKLIGEKVIFWWELSEGVQAYNFRLVSPAFSELNTLIADTVINSNKYIISLPQGKYQWKISAHNQSYHSDWQQYEFTLDSMALVDLSDLETTIISPKEESIWISEQVRFEWKEVEGASLYRLRIASPTLVNPDAIFLDTLISRTKLSLSIPAGHWQAGVTAFNSRYSTPMGLTSFFTDEAYDISDMKTSFNYPQSGDTLIGEVPFYWEAVEGATAYEIQIVTPSFSGFHQLVLIEESTTNQYTADLSPGAYEIMIKPINAKYFGRATLLGFYIDADYNIEKNEVVLLAPTDSLVSNAQQYTFWWQSVAHATTYELVIVSPSFEQIERLVTLQQTTSTQYNIALDSGTYQWSVMAKNMAYSTSSEIRTLIIDK